MTIKKKFVPKIYPKNFSPSVKWYINYYDESGNRKRVYSDLNQITDLEQRKKRALEICLSIQNGFSFNNQEKNHDDFINGFLSQKIGVTPKTKTTYKKQIADFISFFGKNYTDAKPDDAFQFYEWLKAKGLKSKSIKLKMVIVKGFFKYLVKKKVMYENPFTDLPHIKASSQSLLFFNDYQIAKIKNYCLTHNMEYLWFACQLQFYCFIRPKEIRFLKAENFNLSLNTIEIQGAISKNKKTQKVVIPNSFVPEIQFIEKLNPDNLIFHKKNELLARDYLSRKHKEVLKALGIRGRYGFYSWKHTGVVKAVQVGINIKELQMQLRHHSLDMVNEYLKNLGILDAESVKNLFPKI